MNSDIPHRAAHAAHILNRTAAVLWDLPDMIATSFSPAGVHITTASTAAAEAAVDAIERQSLTSVDWDVHTFPVHKGDDTRGNYRTGTVDGVAVSVSAIWHEGVES